MALKTRYDPKFRPYRLAVYGIFGSVMGYIIVALLVGIIRHLLNLHS